MTDWEARVEAAIARTEQTGVSRLRTVPLDMIADAIGTGTRSLWSEADLDRELAALMQRNAFPVPVVLG